MHFWVRRLGQLSLYDTSDIIYFSHAICYLWDLGSGRPEPRQNPLALAGVQRKFSVQNVHHPLQPGVL